MIEQKIGKKIFKSVRLLNRPLKAADPKLDSFPKKSVEYQINSKQYNSIKGILRPKKKENSLYDAKVRPHPSEIGIFNNQAITNTSGAAFKTLEIPSSANFINKKTKILSSIDRPCRLSENIYMGIPGITPGVSTDSGRIHDNLDRLKNEFCRFIDFKYHASTIGNTDLEQRIFLRNCFEKLKEVDYPTIKLQKWNEYQNLLLEQKKNLLLFQKSRGGDQPLDDAWCQTDEYQFDEYVNQNIKIKLDKLREIKMKRLALKKRLFLKGYFDITDFDDIEEIYDDKMLIKLGLDNQFINDSSEDELDDLMNYVDLLDEEGKITYNNYQIKQILGVFDKRFKRKCKPDYYQLFFGRADYEKKIDDKKKRLDSLCDKERVTTELKMKLVNFLDKKLNWTEIETPWEWEQDFVIDEMNSSRKRESNIKLNDLDYPLVKDNIPSSFLNELTEIRKNYRRELLDNALRIYEMKGISNNLECIDRDGELLKMNLYNDEKCGYFSKSAKIIDKQNDKVGEFKRIDRDNNQKHRVGFKEPEVVSVRGKDDDSTYNIIVEREDQPQISASYISMNNSNKNQTNTEDLPSIEIDKRRISIYLNNDMMSDDIKKKIKEDLLRHLNKIIKEQSIKVEIGDSSNAVKNSILNDDNFVNSEGIYTSSSLFDKANYENLENLQTTKSEKLDSCVNNISNIISSNGNLSTGNKDIESIKSQLSVLKNAAGVLEVLKECEQESNLVNNHRKLKDLIIRRIEKPDFNLDQGEIRTLEDGVDEIIKGIIDRRGIDKGINKSEFKDLSKLN